MSDSITRSATFSITSARYLASKIAADLRSMNRLYGRPLLARIDDFGEEAALRLRDSYLDRVDYGMRCRNAYSEWKWVLRLRYVMTPVGALAGRQPGRCPGQRGHHGRILVLVPDEVIHVLRTDSRPACCYTGRAAGVA